MGQPVSPTQHNSISVVCLSHKCACGYLCHASADTLGSACMKVCVSTCERMYVSECVYSVGLWSLSVDLNQPSPVLFAQDMPQEAKTTVHVCPCCEPLLIHPTAAFFHSADTRFISVFIHSAYGICWIPPSSPTFSKETPIRSGVRGIKCQQTSQRQIPHASYII